MPDGPETPPEEAALRAANARLRRVLADRAEMHRAAEAGLRAELAGEREARQAAERRLAGLAEELAGEREARRLLELRLAEVERRLGMNSGNSSIPPSKESPAEKAKRKAARKVARRASQRERSKDRKPGGQPGHVGRGLAPTAEPDRVEEVDPPAECAGCEAGLAGARDAGLAWAQVWDIPPVVLEKVEYRLPRRRCACCEKVTTASVPSGRVGSVTYGPNVNAAAVLLGCEGNVPVERTAMLMEALLGAPVSAGFVARARARLAERLDAAGFDEAVKAALRAEEVLCADETPVNVLRKDTDDAGAPLPGAPHVVAVRTPDERLTWYAPIGARSSEAIADLGVLDGYAGHLVRDDYAAWHQFDARLAGVQQCGSHLIRHLQGVWELHTDWQKWAHKVQQVLREAAAAVDAALAAGRDRLDPKLLADLRKRYDKAVEWGRLTNRVRDWDGEGNHPGYTLALRLAAKAEQVWLFTKNFKIPWTNNASEQALRGPKRHQAVSGYWHTMDTLRSYCRVRSYLASARNHGLRAVDAVHAALAGRPWLPTAPPAAVAAVAV